MSFKLEFPYRWAFDWGDYRRKPWSYTKETLKLWRENLSEPWWWLRCFVQRGWRGYSAHDVGDTADYILTVLTPMLRDIRDHAHGHPCYHPEKAYVGGCLGCFCSARRQAELTRMIEGLEAGQRAFNLEYGEKWDDSWLEKERSDMEQFQSAWRLLGKEFFSLWT